MGLIGDVEELFAGESAGDLASDAKTSDPGIKHPDRSVRVRADLAGCQDDLPMFNTETMITVPFGDQSTHKVPALL
jgi:hypothetical protein